MVRLPNNRLCFLPHGNTSIRGLWWRLLASTAIFFLLPLIHSPAQASTPNTISTIDATLSGYGGDEQRTNSTATDWPSNTINFAYVTWDTTYLYIGVDGGMNSDANELLIYVDKDYGSSNGSTTLSDNGGVLDNTMSYSGIDDVPGDAKFLPDFAIGWTGNNADIGIRGWASSGTTYTGATGNFGWYAPGAANGLDMSSGGWNGEYEVRIEWAKFFGSGTLPDTAQIAFLIGLGNDGARSNQGIPYGDTSVWVVNVTNFEGVPITKWSPANNRPCTGALTITEILCEGTGANYEGMELYNFSNHIINLQNYRMLEDWPALGKATDMQTISTLLIGDSFLISPRNMVTITEIGTLAAFNAAMPNARGGVMALDGAITLSDGGTAPDSVGIYPPYSASETWPIDVLSYNINTSAKQSYEKKDITSNEWGTAIGANWAVDNDPDTGTPGSFNTVSPRTIDLTTNLSSIVISTTANLLFHVRNTNTGDSISADTVVFKITSALGGTLTGGVTTFETRTMSNGVASCVYTAPASSGLETVVAYVLHYVDSNTATGRDTLTIEVTSSDTIAPTYIINTLDSRAYNANPTLNVDFTDDHNLDTVWYQVNSFAGTWKIITTDGSTTTGTSISGTTFTTDFLIQTADWTAMAAGYNTIYFRARDDSGPNDTGTTAATARGLVIYKDVTAPTLTVNRDSYTIKSSSGAMYGYQFDVDALDATSHITALYATVGTADTEQVWGYTGTSNFQTNWRIDSIVYNALSPGHNSVRVTAVDSAGNFASANITISKEAITISTDTSDWKSDELMDTRLNNLFRVTWDDTSLYFSYGGPDGDLGGADLFVYILPDAAAGGSAMTINWGTEGTHTLPFAAKYAMCMDNATLSATNAEFQSAAGGFFSNTADYSNIELSNGAGVVECRIGWNRLGGKPTSSLKIVAFHQYEATSNVYNSYPATNPAGGATGVTFTDYYLWSALSDTVVPTVARLDSLALSGPGSTNSDADFNFTVTAKNSSGQTLTGYNTPLTLSTSIGALAITSTTLTNGTVTRSDSIQSFSSGTAICSATVTNNTALLDTTTITITPKMNSWHIAQNNEPDTTTDADLYMRTATSSAGDTMWPRMRTHDNPIAFWLGKYPYNTETPTATLYYETVGSTSWVSVASSEQLSNNGLSNVYYKFLLNQENNSNWDSGDTVGYYFGLTRAGYVTTYVNGPGTADNVTTSESGTSQAYAQSIPFIYTIRNSAPLPPASPVSPQNGNQNVTSRRPTITWTAADDWDTPSGDAIADYYFDFDDNADMSSPIAGESGWKSSSAVNYTISNNLTYGQTYYWRIKAKDGSGSISDWSSIWSFKIAQGIRAIDGDTTDWTNNYPTSADTSLIKDSEYIWRAAVGDERTDFSATAPNSNFDMSLFRVTGDATNVYFLWATPDITSTAYPMVGIEIDTNLAYRSGGADMGGLSRTVAHNDSALGEIHVLANLTRTGYWTTNFTEWKTRGAGWVESADTSNAIEVSMPWSELGISLPNKVRLTVINGRADAENFMQAPAGWDPVTMSRSLDGITTAQLKSTGFWYDVVTTPDTTAEYYFDVDFDTSGKVIPNKLVVTPPAGNQKTVDTFVLTIRAADFNGNAAPQFNENISIAHNGAGTLTVVDSTAWSSGIKTATLTYSRQETITLTVTELANGKTGSCTVPFRAVPVVRIGEFGVGYTTSDADSDFIELFVANDHNDHLGVNLAGWRIYTSGSGNAALRKTFGTMNVKESSFMTLWFDADPANDETSDGADSRANIYTTSTNGIMTSTEGILQLLTNIGGETVDAVVYGDQATLGANLTAQLGLLVDTGLWSPDNAAANVAPDASLSTKGYALRRDGAFKDSNVKGDWTLDTQTPGNYPGDRYIVTTDSAAPYASGDSFNLRIFAIDSRGDTITNGRFKPTLSITAGTLLPANVTFTVKHADFFSGDTRCSAAVFGTQGSQTISCTSGTMGGQVTVSIHGILDSFALTAPLQYPRADSFSLRIRASDRNGNTNSAFTGAVALTVDNYAIIPTTVTFIAADNGDTTIRAQLVGSVGVITITATGNGKTGSCTTVAITDTSFVISEFLPNDTDRYRISPGRDRDEFVEFYNHGAATKNLSGYTFRMITVGGTDRTYTFPSVPVPAAKFVVVHFNKQGMDDLNFTDTDGAAHLYSFNASPTMADSEDIIPHTSIPIGLFLYASTTQDSSTVVDYIGFDAGAASDPGLPDTDAVNAGIWTHGLTLNLPSTSDNQMGRSFYRVNERVDSNGQGAAEWSTIASNGSTDSYRYTEGFSNINTQPTSPTITLRTSSSTTGDTFVSGDTIYITLTATDGDASSVNTTNVLVYSDTDPQGIVWTLKETNATSGIFIGEVYAATLPFESNDGMRIIAAQPGDTLTVQWVVSPTVKKSIATTGSLDHFTVEAPTAVQSGENFTVTVRAKDAGGFIITTFTGAVTLSTSDSQPYPTSITVLAAGNGETTGTIFLGSNSGAITLTATANGKTGTTTILVITDTGLLINEIMPNPGTIDWDGSSLAEENPDEWVELYNKSGSAIDLTGMKLTHAASSANITLSDSILSRGYVTVYRGGPGTGVSYHFDSMGALVNTKTGLAGNWSVGLPNTGGTVYVLAPGNETIAIQTYTSQLDDSSYGRAPDGVSAFSTFKTPSPGVSPAASPNNISSPNAVFKVDAPVNVQLNVAFTMNAILAYRNGDTVTTWTDTASIIVVANGAATPTYATFANGVTATSVTYTSGTTNDSSGLYVRQYGAIQGFDTVSIVPAAVSIETTQVSVTQAIADGIDTARVQVVVLTAAGAGISGVTVTCTTSKGGSDNLSAASQVTNSNGVCTFTVTTLDSAPSHVFVTANSLSVVDSPYIYWLDPAESGVYTSFGTRFTLLTSNATGHMIQFPVWSSNGKAIAYIAKTAAVDTWAIYVAYDDGAHGDGAANDGTFVTVQVTGTQHNVFQASRPAFADILDAGGARVATGGSGDGVADVIYAAYNGVNKRDLYAVRADGSDVALSKASTVRLTDNTGNWSMPTVSPDTDAMYAIHQGRIYRLYGKGAVQQGPSGLDNITSNAAGNAMTINGTAHLAVDLAMYNRHIMAATFVSSSSGNKKGEVVILNSLDTAMGGSYVSVDGAKVKQVRRQDSAVAWNLSWDTGGHALSWTRDANGLFNYILLWAKHASPEQAYAGTNFDVEVAYITDTQYAPFHATSLINNSGGFNDNGASFSPGVASRVAYVSFDSSANSVKLNVLDIDGVTNVNTSGGLLFERGRLTAVVNESDVLSGSVKIQVAQPSGAPSNPTPESIALTGNAREFFPNGQTFADSITVILYYEDADLAAAGITNGTAGEYSLKVYWWSGSQWIDYNAVVDPTDGMGARGSLSFQTNHFSTYGVGYSPTLPLEAQPLEPTDGTLLTSTQATFRWLHRDPSSRPQVGWQVQAAADTGFESPLLNQSGDGADSAAAVTLPGGDRTLYWRVRTAAVTHAWGQWSSGDSAFLIRFQPPNAPTLISPTNGMSARTLPAFAWTHSDPDSDAQVRVHAVLAADPAFSDELFGEATETTVSTLQLTAALASGTYYWRLRTADTSGFGAWSESRVLVIDRSPLAPTVIAAPDTVTTPSPTFAWINNSPESLPQATVLLEFALDTTFVSLIQSVQVETSTTNLTLTGDNSLTARGSLRIYWRLRTATAELLLGTANFGVASTGSFALSLNAPSSPTLLTPSDGTGTTTATLTFRWQPNDSDGDPQAGYSLRLAHDSTFVSPVFDEVVSGATTERTLGPLAGGAYYWQVSTRDTYGEGPWSAARAFTVEALRLAPLLISPATGDVVTSPVVTLTWQHRDPAGQPQSAALIEVSRNTAFSPAWETRAVTGAGSSLTFDGADSLFFLGETTVWWRARTSVLGTDWGPVASESSFTLRLAVPEAPTALAPSDSLITRQRELEFLWRHRSQNDSLPQVAYELQIAKDTVPEAATTRQTTIGYDDGGVVAWLDGGARYWRVRTANVNGWSPYSAAQLVWIDTAPWWRTARLTTPRAIPSDETRVMAIEVISDTGAIIPWPTSSEVRIGSLVRSGAEFTISAGAGLTPLRIDTPGRYTILVSEDGYSAAESLYVLARASSDTYIAITGRAGVGQRLYDIDTTITVILSANAGLLDSSLSLRITTADHDTLLAAASAPSSVDSDLAYWNNVNVALPAGERIRAVVTRGADTIASELALIFARPGAAASFVEDSSGRGVRVDVPANASDTPFWITIRRTVAAESFAAASDDARMHGRRLMETSVMEIVGEDIDGNIIEHFRQSLTLRIPSGRLDNARIAYLKNGRWEELPGTTFDELTQEFRALSDHLSVWGLTVGTLASGSVQNVRPYPNPWRADGPTALLAHGNAAYGVKFDQLPTGSVRFRIFTIAGELVLDGTLDPATLGATAASGNLQVVDVGGATGQVTRWLTTNQYGEDVASGLYIIVFDGPGGRATRKIAIIR